MPSPADPIAIALGPFEIRWYAIFVILGVVAAVALGSWIAGKRGRDPEFLLDIAFWVVLAGVIGARLYYVMLEWERFSQDPADIINLRTGGLTIHGAVIAGSIMIWYLCRRKDEPVLTWLDIIAPGAALGQAIGRWGNWANQEAFGSPSDLPWALEIDPSRRPPGYEHVATFHPTFLYESLFNLANAAILTWIVLRGPANRWYRSGDVIGLYLITYGVARFIIERIRTDSLYIGPWPAAYWLSLGLIAAGVALIAWRRFVDSGSNPPATAAREEAA